jgi:excisionase family DNA binding protein
MTTPGHNDESILTVVQVAQLLQVHIKTVYRLISERRIPFLRKPGIGYRFIRTDLMQWLQEGYERPDGWKNRL